MSRALLAVVLAACAPGCAVTQRIAADNDDAADYKAFRVASPEGLRLRRAQAYLEAHPRGRWADEVRAAFETEEPVFFEKSQASRESVREYLLDLPRGPHADAAMSLLVAFDTKVEDVETARLTREARRTEAQLESAAQNRRAVGEAVLGAVGALIADDVYGARLEDAPPLLRRVLGGAALSTWGPLPARREAAVFFVIPTRDGRESRVADIVITVEVDRGARGAIVEGRIEGQDLFVRWDEADLLRPLDASAENHRSEAAFHAQGLLEGALEARFPASRCAPPRAQLGHGELVHRACDGWTAIVTWAETEGGLDVVSIRGPRR